MRRTSRLLLLGGNHAPPGLYNFNKENTARLRSALNAVIAGTASYYMPCLSDSTGAGYGAGTDGAGIVDARARAFPKFVADQLTAVGIPSIETAHWCRAGFNVAEFASNGYDPQFTSMPAAWGGTTVGPAGMMFLNNTTTDALAFRSRINVQKYGVIYAQSTNYATMNMAIDGGAPTVVNAHGSASVQRAIIDAGSVGSHELTIARTGAGTNALIMAIDPYDDTLARLRVWNLGQIGASIENSYTNTTNPWNSKNAIDWIVANNLVACWIIDLGINDWTIIGNTPLATFLSNARALLNQIVPYQPVILCIPVPSGLAFATQAKMDEIAGAIYRLAFDEYNIPLVDRRVRFQTSAIASARGWMFDGNHPNEAGQAQKALDIKEAILWALRL